MEDPELYELGSRLDQLIKGAKALLGMQALRYKHVVDFSDQGYQCTYARQSSRIFHEQAELDQLRSQLQVMSRAITTILEELPEDTAEPRWLQNLRLEMENQ